MPDHDLMQLCAVSKRDAGAAAVTAGALLFLLVLVACQVPVLPRAMPPRHSLIASVGLPAVPPDWDLDPSLRPRSHPPAPMDPFCSESLAFLRKDVHVIFRLEVDRSGAVRNVELLGREPVDNRENGLADCAASAAKALRFEPPPYAPYRMKLAVTLRGTPHPTLDEEQ